jgi:hypothetical protein
MQLREYIFTLPYGVNRLRTDNLSINQKDPDFRIIAPKVFHFRCKPSNFFSALFERHSVRCTYTESTLLSRCRAIAGK